MMVRWELGMLPLAHAAKVHEACAPLLRVTTYLCISSTPRQLPHAALSTKLGQGGTRREGRRTCVSAPGFCSSEVNRSWGTLASRPR